MPGAGVCLCGHAADAHRHYRPGSDCALCDGSCPRYRPDTRPRRLARRVLSALRRSRRPDRDVPDG
jgi:heterodisulfide reductase subunit C